VNGIRPLIFATVSVVPVVSGVIGSVGSMFTAYSYPLVLETLLGTQLMEAEESSILKVAIENGGGQTGYVVNVSVTHAEYPPDGQLSLTKK